MRQRGFTLLEIMIVVAIFALLAVTVVINFSREDRVAELREHAKRFEALVSMASEYAILNQKQIGLRIEQNHFLFLYLDEQQQWAEVAQDFLPKDTKLPQPFELQLKLDDLPWQNEDSFFDQDGLFDEPNSFDRYEQEQLEEDEKRIPPPQVFILSSGEITPFSVIFKYEYTEGDDLPTYYRVNAEDGLPLYFEGPLEQL